jgi:serine/threonine protein kinase
MSLLLDDLGVPTGGYHWPSGGSTTLTFVHPGTTLASSMKECPRCFRCWDDAAAICSDDNAPLRPAFAGPAILDGKYRVDQRLGQGGMGVVYQVQHLGLHKTFALKLMANVDRVFLARFRAEAETLGKLKHPNIVDVTDFGIDTREGGLPYLVMEYLEGSTLADCYRRLGRLPLERSLPIFESIAEAIDHAHEHGVLHLDLKPGNVFVSNESSRPIVKILDFGLARFVDDRPASRDRLAGQVQSPVRQATALSNPESEAGPAGVRPEAENLCPECGSPRQVSTNPDDPCPVCLLRLGLVSEAPPDSDSQSPDSVPLGGKSTSDSFGVPGEPRCVGTVAYMAPEVLRGREATTASDIYSFGILIYEVLVGRPPFLGEASEIIAGHCTGAPPPAATLNSALPREVDDALLPAMAKTPSQRPRSAAELVRRIRSAVFRARLRAWRQREIPRRVILSLAGAIILPYASAQASRFGVLQQIENRSVDVRFSAQPTRAPDPRLFLISLDERSLAADPTPLTEKADEFGRELARVFDVGARGIAIDFLLPDTWSRSQPFSDLVLRNPEALTLAAFSSPEGFVIGPECLNALTAAALGPQRLVNLFAFVNLDEDSDGVSRRVRLSYVDQNGRKRDAWARRAIRSLDAAPSEDSSSTVWIDYSVDWRRFPRLSWKDLAATLERQPNLLRDRLVLVGGEFVGFGGDYHRMPFHDSDSQGVSGLVLQALIANSILSGAPFREVAPAHVLLGMGLAVLTIMSAVLLSARWRGPAILGATLVALYVGASILLFTRSRVVLPIGAPLLAAVGAVIVASILRAGLPALPKYSTDGT